MEKTKEFQKKFKSFLKEIKWNPIWSPLDLALIGLLIAATIVASNVLTISTPITKINFSNAFIMLAGIWLGPVAGGFVGGIADVLGCVLEAGVPLPQLVIAPVMVGVLGGIMAPIFKKSKNIFVYAGLTTVITLITTVLIGSWALTSFVSTPFSALVKVRAGQAVINIVLHTIVVNALYRSQITNMLINARRR